MPPLLSKREFLRRNPGGRYKNYRRAYARHQRQARDPFRPLSEEQIYQRAYTDVVPTITAAASALTEALLGRATRSTNEINARSSGIAAALRPFYGSAGRIYGQAQGGEAALGNAMRSAIAGTGQAIGADIESKLTGIQAPGQAVSQYAGGAAATGAASGQAIAGLSSADLERLRSQGSAEQVYAGALPRLAALAGEQERRALLREMGGELTDKLAELYAQQPEMLASAIAGYRKDELDKELAREATRGKTQLARQQEAQKRRELRQRAAQAAADDRRQAQREAARDARRAAQSSEEDRRQAQREAARDARAAAREAARDRRRAATQAAQDKKSGGGGSAVKPDDTPQERREEIRSDLFDRARDYAEPKENDVGRMVNVPKAQAFKRLRQEYGPILRKYGLTQKQIDAMVRNALSAAGY